MKRHFWTIILIGFLFNLFPAYTQAQNAPLTTIATVGNAVPGVVSVPITVVNFSNIGAISLSIDYDYAGLHFVQGIPNPALPSFTIHDNDLGTGRHRVIMGWYGSGTSLANGSTIMTMKFTYISGNTLLEFYDNGPSCEYADANANVLNDIPTSAYYFNGYVCGGVGSPGSISGNTTVCQGQSGVVYSVNPLTNVTGYNWTVPPGSSIVNGMNTNSITVDFGSGSASGSVSVNGLNQCGNGPSSSLTVTVNIIPIANAGNDTTIPYGTSTTLYAASGGVGTFGYHWTPEALLINPFVQNPQTVNLTSTTLFTVYVTNQSTLCQNSDEKIVSISGGPLSANPMAVPNAICHGDTAQLFANAGGGSGNYTFSWTCTPPGSPPWTSSLPNPIVSPDSSRIYHLSLYDGFNIITGSTPLTVYQLPTATISGGDTLCGEGVSTTITIDLTGSPPWSFIYSNGLTSFTLANQNTTPYTINTSQPGTYTVTWVQDAHCTGTTSGIAIVAAFPVPPTPVITEIGNSIVSTAFFGNQWYKDSVLIPGATNQTYTPTETAHYFDIVTINGCASDTSNDIYFVMTRINDHPLSNNFRIEPNPAKNYTRIIPLANIAQPLSIDFYSLTGIKVKGFTFSSPADRSGYNLDIYDLSPGLYFIMIRSANQVSVHKLVIY